MFKRAGVGRGLRTIPRCAAWLLALGLAVAPARGLETDQFTVPPQPLIDIAPEFQQHALAVVQGVLAQVNARYLTETKAAREATSESTRQGHLQKAAECLRDDCITEAVYNEVGPGLVESVIEEWVVRSHFPRGAAKFDPSMGESVYGGNLFLRPLTMQELSPTVHLYGSYMGTDKIGHMFQEGYEYYVAYHKAESAGADRAAALHKANEIGIEQENGFFGLLTIGVYSNADLAANYAGLKFYLNLTRTIHVNGRRLPSILRKRQDLWEINPAAGNDWLHPFFSDHLNESLNPCHYSAQLRDTLRRNFPERAEKWVAFYHSTRAAEAERLKNLNTWYGEDYGHMGLDQIVSVIDLHYDRTLVARR